MMMRPLLAMFLMMLAFPALAAPAGKSSPGGLVYVVTHDDRAFGFRQQSNGTLTPLPLRPQPLAPTVRRLPFIVQEADGVQCAADPARNLLFATAFKASGDSEGSEYDVFGAFQAYHVAPDGRLTPLLAKPQFVAAALSDITVDPQGRFVWVSAERGEVYIFRRGHNSAFHLTGKTGASGTFVNFLMTAETSQGTMTVSPDGNKIYAWYMSGFVDHSESGNDTYHVLSNGRFALDTSATSPFDEGRLSGAAAGGFFYWPGTSSDLEGKTRRQRTGIFVYQMKGHAMTKMRFLIADKNVESLVADPKGRFLYANGEDGIRVYQINRGGGLTLRSHDYGREIQAASRDGRFVYTLKSGFVAARVGANGGLAWLSRTPLPAGLDAGSSSVFAFGG